MSNIYPPCQCTWYCAEQEPWCLRHGNLGNAKNWGAAWRLAGELTTLTPAVGSIVCFQPGVQGAESLGHVAVVIALGSGGFTIKEMNGPAGPCNTDTRVCKLVPGESFLMPLSVPAPTVKEKVVFYMFLAATKSGGKAICLSVNLQSYRWVQSPAELSSVQALAKAAGQSVTYYQPGVAQSDLTKFGSCQDQATAHEIAGAVFP